MSLLRRQRPARFSPPFDRSERAILRLGADDDCIADNDRDNARQRSHGCLPMKRCTLLLSALALMPALAWADNAEDILAAHLAGHRDTLEFREGHLVGRGAASLLAAARRAQFVLIGEDHGFADVPELALALQRSLGTDALPNLVLEVGPYSADRVENALRQGRDALTALNRDYPFALPFLALREDGDLAASFVAAQGTHLWGIDQEFVLSPALHLQTLADNAKDDAARDSIASHQQRVRTRYQLMVKTHDPSQMPLLTFSDKDFAALTRLVGSEGDRQRVAALADSAAIYRSQNESPFASNLARSQLMKRTFMRYYRESAGNPRALFKMGAFHAGRGRSPTGLFDIGNLASELAESNGSRSLHILVLAGGGTVNRWLPFEPDDRARSQPYQAREELALYSATSLLQAAGDDGIAIFDCEALRAKPMPKETPAPLRELLYSYDRIVVIATARAATNDGLP